MNKKQDIYVGVGIGIGDLVQRGNGFPEGSAAQEKRPQQEEDARDFLKSGSMHGRIPFLKLVL